MLYNVIQFLKRSLMFKSQPSVKVIYTNSVAVDGDREGGVAFRDFLDQLITNKNDMTLSRELKVSSASWEASRICWPFKIKKKMIL